MFNGIFRIPEPKNEPCLQYAPGSPERAELKAKLKVLLNGEIEVPMIIGGEEVRNGKLADIRCPHDHRFPHFALLDARVGNRVLHAHHDHVTDRCVAAPRSSEHADAGDLPRAGIIGDLQY